MHESLFLSIMREKSTKYALEVMQRILASEDMLNHEKVKVCANIIDIHLEKLNESTQPG